MINGQSIVIKGDICGGEDLVIAGRVEGSITLAGRALTLAAGSQVVGVVSAAAVTLSGRVEGRVEATERLEVKETAEIEGDLSTPTLVVADGARLKTTIDMPLGPAKSNLRGVA
jgi:cytoskeletal protein CcmA (bactofilin family)